MTKTSSAAHNERDISAAPEYILEARHITKTYVTKHGHVSPLNDASLAVTRGETVSLTGRSGCGKSTLLYILGLMEPTTSGEIYINGRDCTHISERQGTALRGKHLGFIYQFHGLLGDFTAEENVLAPFMIKGAVTSEAKERAEALLHRLGIYERRNHMPKELSGGEQQRVAAARAFIKKPDILLADEPTGNLDEKSARIIMDTALSFCQEEQTSFICVTHNNSLADECASRYEILDGKVYRKK